MCLRRASSATRARGRAVHAGRRPDDDHRGAGPAVGSDRRRPRPRDQRPALAAGGARGLSISSPDAAVRAAHATVIARLIELCAELGGSYLVHGSPAQRNPQPGQSACRRAGARHRGLGRGRRARGPRRRHLLHRAAVARRRRRWSTRSPKPLAIVEAAALPDLKTMLDTQFGRRHRSRAAARADRALVASGSSGARAAQRPQPPRPWPGRATASRRCSRRCARQGYAGWLAMEPFDYVPDGPGCAAHVDRLCARAARGGGCSSDTNPCSTIEGSRDRARQAQFGRDPSVPVAIRASSRGSRRTAAGSVAPLMAARRSAALAGPWRVGASVIPAAANGYPRAF